MSKQFFELIMFFCAQIDLIKNMKNSLKQLLTMALALAMVLVVASCGDDDASTDGPIISTPDAVTIDEGASTTVNFTVSTPGGFAAVNVEATNGTANVDSQPSAGDLSGIISITFEATGTGAGAVVITVSDAGGKTNTSTAVLNIMAQEASFTTREFAVDQGGVTFNYTEVSGVINEDFTFGANRMWVLDGRVIVSSGATLTIEPGTIVKGREGNGALASVLLIARGATIQANGTAAAPIIFTSFRDDINVGETTSTLDVDNDLGLWGGVLILGNAPIVAGAAEEQIEGIPSSVTEGLYGGTDATDNSGSFTYVSIRFSGTELAPGSELQGLTLGGVGNGTTISHVESANSADDGIEIFGGTVNISNFLVLNPDDDGFDADQGWSGTASNLIYIGQKEGVGFDSDHAFELDGPEGSDSGDPEIGTFTKATIWGRSASDQADLRDGAQYNLNNMFFFGFADGHQIELDADGSVDPSDDTKKLSDNEANAINYDTDVIVLTGLEFLESTGVVIGDLLGDKLKPELTGDQAAATARQDRNAAKFAANNSMVSAGSTAAKADVSQFTWTMASGLGLLTNSNF